MRTVAVTGANGFVGRTIVRQLAAAGWRVRSLVRSAASSGPDLHAVGDISGSTDWAAAIAGCEAIVHLAGLAHVQGRDARGIDERYRAVNVDGTLALARAAAAAGIRRFVYLSSAKVNGEGREEPYRIDDQPAPVDAYAQSKWMAEQGLAELAEGGGLEPAIIRPPLVYGPWVRANFLRLIRMVDRGLPLPFGGVANRRSVVFVGNLGSMISKCLDGPPVAPVLFPADAAPLSTPDLLRAIAAALGKPSRLFGVPTPLLQTAASATGKGDEAARLLGSFVVDTVETNRRLSWSPPYSTAGGLAETASWFKAERIGR